MTEASDALFIIMIVKDFVPVVEIRRKMSDVTTFFRFFIYFLKDWTNDCSIFIISYHFFFVKKCLPFLNKLLKSHYVGMVLKFNSPLKES